MATPTVTSVERSGPAIRAALATHSPHECAEFESELRQALAAAGHDLNVAPVDAVLDRWWGIAYLRANPLTAVERAAVERAHRGDFTGLYARDEQGNWTTL